MKKHIKKLEEKNLSIQDETDFDWLMAGYYLSPEEMEDRRMELSGERDKARTRGFIALLFAAAAACFLIAWGVTEIVK